MDTTQEQPKSNNNSPLVSLEKDLKLYSEAIQETAADIIDNGFSNFPIFIAHQHKVDLGETILNKDELHTQWSINASTLEELEEKSVIQKERVEFFIKNYKDPVNFMCLFVVVPQGANFVFYPYK